MGWPAKPVRLRCQMCREPLGKDSSVLCDWHYWEREAYRTSGDIKHPQTILWRA